MTRGCHSALWGQFIIRTKEMLKVRIDRKTSEPYLLTPSIINFLPHHWGGRDSTSIWPKPGTGYTGNPSLTFSLFFNYFHFNSLGGWGGWGWGEREQCQITYSSLPSSHGCFHRLILIALYLYWPLQFLLRQKQCCLSKWHRFWSTFLF